MEKLKRMLSDIIRAHLQIERAGFKNGFGRSLGLFGNPYFDSINNLSERSIQDALNSDWQRIGGDFRRAVTKHPKLQNVQQEARA